MDCFCFDVIKKHPQRKYVGLGVCCKGPAPSQWDGKGLSLVFLSWCLAAMLKPQRPCSCYLIFCFVGPWPEDPSMPLYREEE